MFYHLLPSTSVGDEYGQQMRIQILILGFEGLRLDVHTIPDSAYSGTKTILDRYSGTTQKNGDFGAISATERSCLTRISKQRAPYIG